MTTQLAENNLETKMSHYQNLVSCALNVSLEEEVAYSSASLYSASNIPVGIFLRNDLGLVGLVEEWYDMSLEKTGCFPLTFFLKSDEFYHRGKHVLGRKTWKDNLALLDIGLANRRGYRKNTVHFIDEGIEMYDVLVERDEFQREMIDFKNKKSFFFASLNYRLEPICDKYVLELKTE